MNNLQLNYLVAQERIDDLALAAERYRLAQRVVNSGSQRRSFIARVLLRLRRRGTQVAAVRDARLAGAAQRSSLDGEARGLTISPDDGELPVGGQHHGVAATDFVDSQTIATDDAKALAHGEAVLS
jgi:hypothetical protein